MPSALEFIVVCMICILVYTIVAFVVANRIPDQMPAPKRHARELALGVPIPVAIVGTMVVGMVLNIGGMPL